VGKWGGHWFADLGIKARWLFGRAFAAELTSADVVSLSRSLAWSCLWPLALGGAALMGISFGTQLAVTGLGVSFAKLKPNFNKFNPISKVKEMMRQNVSSLLQAVLLTGIAAAAISAMLGGSAAGYLSLPMRGLRQAVAHVGGSLQDLLWKAAYVFIAFGAIELFRERRHHQKSLRMTKQEVKEEMKDTEGNPQMKARIRRIQRDQARKRMMQAVPTATAVVVNPTHYAVAIQYEPGSMRAPRVVAKGKNYLALRIKQRAVEHLVPIIENPPLARALYKAVDIGQEIPPDLYRAVAEVLAYIFKIMGRGGVGRK
jgi:flagellar biosynthetic protein FlhB